MLDYGGRNWRCVGNRQFQFIELINMDSACGRDNEGHPKYHVELRFVDLNAISADNLQSALNSCGWQEMPDTDEAKADCLDSYGCHAPLGQWSGNNARKLMRESYREANSLLDQSALSSAMDKTVNKIGSTAREFMQGDIFSAMQRGCEAGNPDSRITAKMYGIPQNVIDDTRPVDFLPYLMGYMCAMNGGNRETDPDTSPEYFRGYERGENVKAGKCPAPGWIKQA